MNERAGAGRPRPRGASIPEAAGAASDATWAAVERFLALASRASDRVLLLDYDGTLAPFRANRRAAVPYPEAARVVKRIAASPGGRLGIVSGRPLENLRAALRWLPSRVDLWGSHGLEHAGPGAAKSERDPPAPNLVDDVRKWARAEGLSDLFEPKPFGFALHGRGVSRDRFAKARAALTERWALPARALGLEPVEFDGGLEYRPSGRHKGEVVESVLAGSGTGAAIAYLGDDATDEDAFRALKGRGLSVLVRSDARSTAADVRLRPPEELVRFLLEWERAISSAPSAPGGDPPGAGS